MPRLPIAWLLAAMPLAAFAQLFDPASLDPIGAPDGGMPIPAGVPGVTDRGEPYIYTYCGFSPVCEGRIPAEYRPWPGSPFPEGGTMEVYAQGQDEPYLTWPSWGTYFASPVPFDTAFLVRLTHDSGFSAAAYVEASPTTSFPSQVNIGVPVPDLAPLGMEPPKRTFLAEDSPRGFAGVIFVPLLTDDATGRGPLFGPASIFLASDPPRAAWMRVEYLAGCNLFGRPDDTYTFAKQWRSPQGTVFYWDDSPRTSDRTWNVAGPVPDGPVRLHFSMDGYTTATLEAEMIPGTHVWWYPVQAPLVPSEQTPLPTQRQADLGLYTTAPPPQWIIDRARVWRDSGLVTEFSNLTPYLDAPRREVGP